jgi:hypothetical protein
MMGVLCGCAVSYTDAEGMGHIVGIVDVVVKRPTPENIAGSIVDVTTVGVSVLSWDDRLSMGLGYLHLTSADFLDNALAIGPFDKVLPGRQDKNSELRK